MSNLVGPLTFGKKDEEIFLGREIAPKRDYSENTAIKIDEEVARIIREAEKEAMKLLKDNEKQLHRVAKELLKYETIDGNDLDKIMAGKRLRRRPKSANGAKDGKAKESASKTSEEKKVAGKSA